MCGRGRYDRESGEEGTRIYSVGLTVSIQSGNDGRDGATAYHDCGLQVLVRV